MVNKIEGLSYYELLEVDPKASTQEIHKAYERMRALYDPNSIAIYSLFSPRETELIRQRIEEAYRTLVYEEERGKYDKTLTRQQGPAAMEEIDCQGPSPSVAEPRPSRQLPPRENRPVDGGETPQSVPPFLHMPDKLHPAPVAISEFSGIALKELREQRNLSIRNLADITKVSSRYLQYIEEESFHGLPARIYLRGYLALYAKALAYEPDRIVDDYMKRYEAAVGNAANRC